jgi:hypothetical protein
MFTVREIANNALTETGLWEKLHPLDRDSVIEDVAYAFRMEGMFVDPKGRKGLSARGMAINLAKRYRAEHSHHNS